MTLQHILFCRHILGVHVNVFMPPTKKPIVMIRQVLGQLMPSWFDGKLPLSDLLEESGYLHIQATKPDTVGKKGTMVLNSFMKYNHISHTAPWYVLTYM
jgi:hypothetical protein